MSGKKSAKEAIPGGAIGILVGVGAASSIGAVVSSFILGNRRRG